MPAPLDPDMDVVERSLGALARTRSLGLHTLGHFAGVTGRSAGPGRSVLELTPPRWSAGGRAGSATELAVLIDLTLGSAIRSALGPGLRLGTISLTVDHLSAPSPGPLTASGRTDRVVEADLAGQGRADVVDAHGVAVATSTGWFVALPPPEGRPLPPVPWESNETSVPDLAVDDLDAQEREVHDALVTAAARGDRCGLSAVAALTAPRESDLRHPDEGAVAYVLPTGPALGNRVRQAQGGALYGAAASAAEALAGPEWEVGSGHVQFLRPVSAPEVEVRARALRRGRRVVFTDVEMAASGRPVLTGRFTLRPATPNRPG
ncbi:MAG: hypothetical protein GEU93_16450 [Propionibacteriales bacterium]|nr:hypothetical protein [Propionibacteriales bacterium]